MAKALISNIRASSVRANKEWRACKRITKVSWGKRVDGKHDLRVADITIDAGPQTLKSES